MVRITALIENTPSGNKSLLHEHGLSLLIDDGYVKVLFDCGADGAFISNARRMGVALDDFDAVVISHSHYDHAGGFRDFAEAGFRVPSLYVGKGFFQQKYSRSGIRYTYLGSGWDEEFAMAHGFSVRAVDGISELSPSMTIFSNFPRIHSEETIPTRFVKSTGAGFVPDDFSDEIAIGIKTDKGLVVIVGCSHPGIMNILSSIKERTGEDIYAVFGGTHLKEADTARAEATVEYLAREGVSIAGFCHCSGSDAIKLAAERFGDAALSAGDSVLI